MLAFLNKRHDLQNVKRLEAIMLKEWSDLLEDLNHLHGALTRFFMDGRQPQLVEYMRANWPQARDYDTKLALRYLHRIGPFSSKNIIEHFHEIKDDTEAGPVCSAFLSSEVEYDTAWTAYRDAVVDFNSKYEPDYDLREMWPAEPPPE